MVEWDVSSSRRWGESLETVIGAAYYVARCCTKFVSGPGCRRRVAVVNSKAPGFRWYSFFVWLRSRRPTPECVPTAGRRCKPLTEQTDASEESLRLGQASIRGRNKATLEEIYEKQW